MAAYSEATEVANGLRERAATFGMATLGDAEVLELFLGRILPRGARTWAQVLLKTWPSFEAIVCADTADLAAVIGGPAAVDLKLLHEATLRIAAAACRARELITSSHVLETYLRVRLAQRSREQFRVMFLDNRNRLIADEALGEGTTNHAPVYPREVVRRALQLDASAVILVHNHPSGDANPSRADVEVTKVIVEACKALNIKLHDHLVVAADQVVSMKALGLI